MSDHPFSLRGNPFADSHDPRAIYPAARRVEALELLRRRIAEGDPFVTVTGEPGCGKTSIISELLEGGDLKARAALIAHPSLTPSELVEAVCLEFEAPLPHPPSKPQALASLDRRLRELRAEGFATVLVLDEAHGLKTELLEEARLLSNMKADGRALLQTILVGLPELERRMGMPELAQLRQRIGVHCRLAPLGVDETRGYIQHRVDAAGGDGEALFPAAACLEVHNYTNGIPRDINTLAGRALECAAKHGAAAVDVEHVRMAAGDARPHGIATAPRAPAGAQPFELKRTAHLARPVAPVARALERPADRPLTPRPSPIARASERPAEPSAAPAPAAPVASPRPASAQPPVTASPTPAAPAGPPSFLRSQQVARGGEHTPGPKDPAATLEHRFRNGDVTAEEKADGGRGAARRKGLFGSEGVRELAASAVLVGLLVVVLMATGRWQPGAPASQAPDAGTVAPSWPEGPRDPASGSAQTAAIRSEPLPEPTAPPVDPSPARIESPSPMVAPTSPVVAPPPPVASMPDLTLGAGPGPQRGIGFEVASVVHPDSARKVLEKVRKGSKLPVRMVTRTSGNPYRVVVGPFQTRREAEKAITELFRKALVERARIVQIVE